MPHLDCGPRPPTQDGCGPDAPRGTTVLRGPHLLHARGLTLCLRHPEGEYRIWREEGREGGRRREGGGEGGRVTKIWLVNMAVVVLHSYC